MNEFTSIILHIISITLHIIADYKSRLVLDNPVLDLFHHIS